MITFFKIHQMESNSRLQKNKVSAYQWFAKKWTSIEKGSFDVTIGCLQFSYNFTLGYDNQFTLINIMALNNFPEGEVFQSKESLRLGPKPGLNLQDIILDKLISTLKDVPFGSERNAKSRKEIQSHFYNRVPKVLQREILVRAAHVHHLKAESMLNICESLGSHWVVKDFFDLTGGYVGSDWCHLPGNWRWGNGSEWSMRIQQCERLFRILSWGDIGSLRHFAICAFSDAVNKSKLPSILARAHLLQQVTILCGATDHLLRIIGLNCPLLKKLKIYGSEAVTDIGLRNFFMKRPRCQQESQNRNKVANSIEEIQIFRTGISRVGCEFACRQMNLGYAIPFLPNNGIFRCPPLDTVVFFDMKYDGTTVQLEQFGLTPSFAKSLRDTIDICIAADGYFNPVLDMYGTASSGSIYLRARDSMLAVATFQAKINTITELTLTWNTVGSWDWDWGGPPSISDLMETAPNLRRLRSRVIGQWNGSAIFPNLEYAEIWTCTFVTLASLLRWAPALKTFDCRSIGDQLLDDTTLAEILSFNIKMAQTLTVFNVRPTLLTHLAVLNLQTSCPNIKSIGDLQNWNLDSRTITMLNSYLDSVNSQCVLKVCNFPPVNPYL